MQLHASASTVRKGRPCETRSNIICRRFIVLLERVSQIDLYIGTQLHSALAGFCYQDGPPASSMHSRFIISATSIHRKGSEEHH
jgi:hypothetical protein